MAIHLKITLIACVFPIALSLPDTVLAQPLIEQSQTEEARIQAAQDAIPDRVNRYQGLYDAFSPHYNNAKNELEITELTANFGTRLWQQAVRDVQSGFIDDRPLYWGRLKMRHLISEQDAGFNLRPWQRDILKLSLEQASRGISDIKFHPGNDINILLTGFDPFFLDKDIQQSNPSGVVALALDGQRFTLNGKRVQIETVMIPVRFQDFDNGLIEAILTPLFRTQKVQLLFTVSMGREAFDLERFPALNRSATAPDNLNQLTGASKTQPIAPRLNAKPLMGPEFVEFSLPVQAMMDVNGPWAIKDNHQVTTLNQGQFTASSLAVLSNATSVEGSGGGYLSNEISYRSILLKQQFHLDIPVGHIHTPRIEGHDAEQEAQIVEQVRNMIIAAAKTL